MKKKTGSLELLAEALVESDYQFIQELIASRLQSGLSQEEVGIRMGVSQPSVAAFEAADSNPTMSTIRRYALAVGVHISHEITNLNNLGISSRVKTSK